VRRLSFLFILYVYLFVFLFFDLKDNGQEKNYAETGFVIGNASSDCSFSEQ